MRGKIGNQAPSWLPEEQTPLGETQQDGGDGREGPNGTTAAPRGARSQGGLGKWAHTAEAPRAHPSCCHRLWFWRSKGVEWSVVHIGMALREDEPLTMFFPLRRTQKISKRWRFPEKQRKWKGKIAVEVKGRWQKGPAVTATDLPTSAVSSLLALPGL